MSLRERAAAEADRVEAEYRELEELADALYERRDWLRYALEHLYPSFTPTREGSMAKTNIELTEAEIAELREAVVLREDDLEKARKYCDRKGLSTTDIEERQKVLKGDGPMRPGLKAKLGFRDEPDPDQNSLPLDESDE